MKSNCEIVAELVVLGEPLGALSSHVASCQRCQALVDMPGKLGATRHAVDPGLGFSARMTVGAQHRIVVRHRRRIALGLAATVAAAAVGVFAMTRSADAPESKQAVVIPKYDQRDIRPVTADEADLMSLVRLADTHRSSHVSAPWGRINKPLAPYRKLLKGVTQ
jgi:hypothetical protein